ncbi:unnamed protein product [Adineta steineri]|uniref:ZP domain-containing protein n=1 Tax=Adineta steineri TaxID=433720 RepID=A0A814LS80_9BILA|nr:unnamed protein product [Adineta steineri]CAF3574308.1 unnamed protein product [Adineta steineri]
MRLTWIVVIGYLYLRNFILGQAENTTHANTTRLCRNNCRLSSVAFQPSFTLPSDCGSISAFYGCRVEINVNYTRHTFAVTFSGYTENSIEMFEVDYDYFVDEGLNLHFYRNLFDSTVIFTCLTDDQCTDEYASIVIQRLIDSESILYELLPLYLDKSLVNRTITCVNDTNDEVLCYGGYCESMVQETITDWSFHDCVYPAESIVLSTTELTSLTAFFFQYEPENPSTEQVNDHKMVLLCNVDLCNSMETRNRGKLILDRYNEAAFSIFKSNTTTTTMTSSSSLSSTTTTIVQTTNPTSIYSSSSPELFTATSSSSFTSAALTTSSTDENILSSSKVLRDLSENEQTFSLLAQKKSDFTILQYLIY